MWGAFKTVVRKEIIQLRRDPATRFIFAIPLVWLLLFGYAIETDVRNVSTVVFDLSRSRESRELIGAFESTRYFRVVGRVYSDDELEGAIIRGEAKAGVKIPPDYAERLVNGRQAHAQVLIDGSDSTIASRLLQASQAIGLIKSRDGDATGASSPSLEVRPRLLFNPNLDSANFFVPGLIGVILQLVTVFLTAFSIVRERERGTLEQLLVTPVPKSVLILGKLFPYCIVGLVQTAIVLVAMVGLFGVPIQGSVVLLILLSALFLVPALGMGIVISTFATNQAEAMQMGVMVMLPSILLSGFIFPRESMPFVIYLLSFLLPATYYIEILRGVILRGAEWAALRDEAAVLAAFAVILILLSLSRFKKRLG